MSDAAPGRVVLVTGLSGAGRSSTLRALEDLGYEAIDNLPTEAIERIVTSEAGRLVGIGVDVRSRGFNPDALLNVVKRLKAQPDLHAELVFAVADDATILRRYTETRRRHPMSPQGRVTDGIAAERALTVPLHEAADFVLDTTDLSPTALRQWIEQHFGAESDRSPQAGLSVALVSFGYPGGLPREADLVFDARFLRNPHYVPALRPLTGRDAEVADYVAADPDFAAYYGGITGLLDLVLPRFVLEGKKYATVAIGCTGGRHRSVTLIEKLAAHLAAQGWRVTVTHRELAREAEQAHIRANQAERSAQAARQPMQDTP
jgi:UPF0042 nucleotide-binding protein